MAGHQGFSAYLLGKGGSIPPISIVRNDVKLSPMQDSIRCLWQAKLLFAFENQNWNYLGALSMYQSKRFGTVSSWQEYQMLCRAERHMKQKKKSTGQRLPAKFILKKI